MPKMEGLGAGDKKHENVIILSQCKVLFKT